MPWGDHLPPIASLARALVAWGSGNGKAYATVKVDASLDSMDCCMVSMFS